jgi:CRISPR/Cas system CSM-associated protein Csm3 (group 7 of RAMP superfamily)
MDALCYRISAAVTAVTPLHAGSGQRTGVIKRTYGYIPGSMLRGAIGTSLIKNVCKMDSPLANHEECQHFNDCVYTRLFGEEFGKASNVFFRYAYPIHIKCGGVYTPAPKTLYICKSPQCRKTFDNLIPPTKCECGEDIEPFHGFRCGKCQELCERPVAFSRTTSTAIDRSHISAAMVGTGKARGGTLHTTETIKKGSKFAVEILISKNSVEDVDVLKAVLERGLEDEGIGGGKSRGLGKVKVGGASVLEVSEQSVRKRATEIGSDCFSVRLLSPMLLEGKTLDNKSLLEGCRRAYTWLFHEGKPKLEDVKLEEARAESEIFSGWSLKTQMRRRIEPAISAGSVFQFRGRDKDETLALGLAALELHAIGAYKPHGCGQVNIEPCR